MTDHLETLRLALRPISKPYYSVVLSNEISATITRLASTYGLTRSEVITVFADHMNAFDLDGHFKARPQISEKRRGKPGRPRKIKVPPPLKPPKVTYSGLSKRLKGLPQEHLARICETAWKLRGKEGNFEESRTPYRKTHMGGIVSIYETIQQIILLNEEQLTTLANFMNELSSEPQESRT